MAGSVGPSIAVIGIGNAMRGDDAAGLLVLKRLAQSPPEGVVLATSDGEATRLLAAMEGCDAVVLVDAVVTGAAPGTVHCWFWGAAAPVLESLRCSTHTLSVVDALALAEALGRRLPALVIIAVEAQFFELGAPLSPAVAAALDPAVARLRLALRKLQVQEDGTCMNSP
jgi:hydrogenase maturation protease